MHQLDEKDLEIHFSLIISDQDLDILKCNLLISKEILGTDLHH